MNTVFLEPLDVLYLRGNPHFGTAGSHGAALMPPWPSLAAGAIRSRLMAEGEPLDALAGFRLTHFGLARLADSRAEPLLPLPADVMVTTEALDDARYAQPIPIGLPSSYPLPKLPVFAHDKPSKPQAGLWLNRAGIAAWLTGAPITKDHLVRSKDLWQSDPRLGIALDPGKRTAAESRIYTAEAVALEPGIGFVATYEGAPALPANALVRLGGDGRGAVARMPAFSFPEPDWARIEQERRFRLLLVTPAPLPNGWRPAGVPGKLVAASVNRAETVSGWDLAANDKGGAPKRAQRVAPAGSVYWFEDFDGDLNALQTLARTGLALTDPARAAEGFGKLAIAPWAA